MKLRKRALSLLLSLIMVFSIVPTSVFADGEVDTESGPASGGYGSTADGSWTGSEKAAMRMSLYFTEGKPSETNKDVLVFTAKDTGEKIEIRTSEEFLQNENLFEYRQIGKTIDFYKDLVPSEVTFYSGLSVYERMHKDEIGTNRMFDNELKNSGYTDMTQNMYSVVSDFPVIFEKNGKADKYVSYFMGQEYMKLLAEKGEEYAWNNADIYEDGKLMAFIKAIIKKDENVQTIDFIKGVLIDGSGQPHQGAFKFYFEPVVEIMIGGKWFAVTLRDMIAMQNSMGLTFDFTTKDGTKMTNQPLNSAFATLSRNLGNTTRLTHDQPLVSMFAHTGGDITSSSYDTNSALYKSGGLGVITGIPHEIKTTPEVKVVESYIKIVGYDENGNAKTTVKTEQPLASKAYMAEVSKNGTISIEHEKKDKNMDFKLNDIYVASTDIVPNKTGEVPVIWLEKLPFNAVTGAQLSKSPKDLDGYIANLVLENADFIENMKRYSKDEYNLETFINQALKTFTKAYYQANGYLPNATETVEIIADYVGTTVNNVYRVLLESKVVEELLCEILKFVPDNCESIPVTADTKLDTLKAQKGDNCVWAKSDINSLPMNYWSWTNIGYLAELAKDETGNVDYEKVGEYASRMELAFKTNFTGNPNTVTIESPKSNASVATPKQEEELFEDVETVVYLRYIVTEVPKQVNILIHKRDGKEVKREIVETPQSLDISKGFTKLVDIRTDTETTYPYVKYIESWRSKEYKDDDPNIKTDGMTKTPVTDIKTDSVASLGSDETVYVFWEVNEGTPVQVNILTDKTTNEKTHIGTNPLVPEGGKTPLKDMREEMPEIVPVEYYTDPEFTEDPDNIPPRKPDEKHGTDVTTPIEDLPPDKTVYVFWEVEKPVETKADVPQWRLSRYFDEVGPWVTSSMTLSFGGDGSPHVSSYLTPTGYSYHSDFELKNPNGKINDNSNTPDNMKFADWLHVKTKSRGSDSVSHGKTTATISVNGEMNLIKYTDKNKINLANWLNRNNPNVNFSEYDIDGGVLPETIRSFTNSTVYPEGEAVLPYELHNTHTYTHYRSVYKGDYCGDEDCNDPHCDCECFLSPELARDGYNPGYHYLTATFARYATQKHDKLVVSPVVNVENGLTTLKYQLTDNLNVYPEVGMLFEDNNQKETLEWTVGEENRQINPVVYQTLQHKVYVSAVSSGTSVATDSRAITNAQRLGEGNKQVIYKGSAIGNAFTLHQDSSKQSAALLTVKTYALDINTKNADLKSAWGDSNYHSDKQHEVLINSLNGQTAKYDEKLLIDSPNYGNLDYTGGSITTNTNNKYELRNYSGSQVATKVPLAVGGNAIVLEHELIVRGGKLVAVRVKDTNGGTTLKSIEQLRNEGKDSKTSLYAVLVNMHLIDESGNRSNTVFTAFEHLTGDVLTEQEYATLLNSERKKIDDNYDSTSEVGVSVGQGWYSEDTTVLVVKEYISNLTVPSVSVTDKIALSVNGLVTPQNKAQFFNTMGKGYLYLNYDLTCKGSIYNTLPEIHSGFTFTSFPNDEYGFGDQQVNYLVPNVSITDTTRLN